MRLDITSSHPSGCCHPWEVLEKTDKNIPRMRALQTVPMEERLTKWRMFIIQKAQKDHKGYLRASFK